MAKLLIFVFLAIIGAATWIVLPFLFPGSPPHLESEWWGPMELKGKEDRSVKPFTVQFSPEMVKDLKARLKNHRELVPPLEGVGFEYGFNSKQIAVWTKYWSQEYNFTEREKFFNKFPQFKTNIQGLDIHFIRVKPQVASNVEVVPLLLMHGWPGSVREFYEAIPLLTRQVEGYDFAFEVIVPSLPGYGFSQAAMRPGLGAIQVGVIFKNLMDRLGFKKFYVQGGDWGSAIASAMVTLYPNEILGHHSNSLILLENGSAHLLQLIGSVFPSLIVEPHLADRMYPLSKRFAYYMEEFGYMHIQATKPDTVGVGLTDSPTGLLAYILEKFSSWTVDSNKYKIDGGLDFAFTKEQLIDNLMVYWSTKSITTSMRLYAETMSKKNRDLKIDSFPTTVPTWGIQAKNELFYLPPFILKFKYQNLLGVTVLEEGGHFFAFEKPKIFVDDIFKAVKLFRQWHKTKTEL